jgi:Asp-tRNA(Asn)/Glu-tRNA(Gln) amidotransferase B subunit
MINKPECREMSVEDIARLVAKSSYSVPAPDINIDDIIKKVLAENESAVQSYKAGKQNALQFLIGMVLKEAGGKISPDAASAEMKKTLDL